MMESSKKIVSGAFWSALVNFTGAVYGFIAVPMLINHFGEAEYGLIGLAMSVNVYLQLMDLGFNSTNVRFYSTWLAQNKQQCLKDGFQTSLTFYGVVGLINAIVVLCVSFFSQNIFNVSPEQNAILKHLFYILAVSALCSWFSSCFDQIIKATENVAWCQKRTLFTKFLMIGVLLVTVYCDLSIEIYYIFTTLATLCIVPLSIKKIKKELPFVSFVPNWNKDRFKEMLPYCLNIFSFSLFQFSFYNLRPVFLGIQGSMESVAEYRILNGVVGVVIMVGSVFMGPLLPSTSKVVAEGNRDAYYRVAYDGTKYISILVCLCCFGMMSVAPELLTLYVGKDFLHLVAWLNLWLVCTIATHNQAISTLILAGDDIRAISYISAVSSIIGLIISWKLIPSYGVGGVVIAYAVYNVLQLSFYYFFYWPKRMHINSWTVFSRALCPYLIVGLFCYILATSFFSTEQMWQSLIAKGFVFILLYFVLCFFLLTKNDRAFLKNILGRKR